MSLSTQSFSQFVSNSVAAMQGAAATLIDMTVGAVLRSFVDAYCLLALWFQAIALQTASLTRFATSNGPDADSWGADFGYYREGADAASGQVTFARFTPSAPATVDVGEIVQTQAGVQYQVIADTTQSAFNATLNAYVLATGVASCTATVEAVVAGPGGNVAAGLINQLASSIPGVDTVTNASAFSNGAPAQSDPVYKAGFPLFLASLRNATPAAIKSAILSVGPEVDFTFTENYTLGGAYQPGYFYVIVDNGTGSPPSGFLTAVGDAIEAVRGATITYGVFASTIQSANVVMAIDTAAGYVHATVCAEVAAAIDAYINSLPIGATLAYSILPSVAYGIAGVTNVPLGSYTLNGAVADLTATSQQINKAGTTTVT